MSQVPVGLVVFAFSLVLLGETRTLPPNAGENPPLLQPDAIHLGYIELGVNAWNRWRFDYPTVKPNLAGANLVGHNLSGVNFSGADLRGSNLAGATLEMANVEAADFSGCTGLKTVNWGKEAYYDSNTTWPEGFAKPNQLVDTHAMRQMELAPGDFIGNTPAWVYWLLAIAVTFALLFFPVFFGLLYYISGAHFGESTDTKPDSESSRHEQSQPDE